MTGPKQVICINWGTKYGASYINRLYGMVARNLTPPFSFTCFTDSAEGVRPEVACRDLPPIAAEMPVRTKGKWPKSRLWGPSLAELTGPVLFLDLDLVVTGPLDGFFEVGGPHDVVMARNPSTPLERLGQTSVYRFPVGKLVPLQERFAADPQAVADEYRFEQRFVTRNAPGGVTFFPRGWVRHFRRDCRRAFPLNYALAPRLPTDARVVLFAGSLDAPDAIAGRYSDKDPGGGALAHLGRTFRSGEGPIAHLRHYIRPTPWVAEHWRE